MKHFPATIMLLAICSTLCPGAELTVQVTNGTADGAPVADDEVIVQVFESRYLLHTFNGRVNADGKAFFNNVPEGDHLTAVARARHQDMMFSGRPVSLQSTEDGRVASVQVFDVSDDKSPLSVETHHLIIKVRPGAIEVTEYMQLRNSCDMAISSSERDAQNRTIVLEIKLPTGFKNLRSFSYFQEKALVITKEGFYDIMAIPPGEQHITFAYTLDVSSETMDFAKTISLPTSNFALFAELGQAKIQGLGGTQRQAMRSRGESLRYYERGSLAPGEEVTLQLTNLDVGSPGRAKWIIAAAAICIIAALIVLRLRPRKKVNPRIT
ncbi:MAG: hypothetical protein ACYSWO_18145 [Planctomycetota bacterium]